MTRGDYRDCYFVFFKNHQENPNPDIDKTILAAFEAEFGKSDLQNPTIWPAVQYMPNDKRVWNDDVLTAIQFDGFSKEIILIVERLKRVADQICQDAAVA